MMDTGVSSPASLPSEGWQNTNKCLCWNASGTGAETRKEDGSETFQDPRYKDSAESQRHRMVWAGADLTAHPVPATRPGCSKPHLTCPRTFPVPGPHYSHSEETRKNAFSTWDTSSQEVLDWNLNNLRNYRNIYRNMTWDSMTLVGPFNSGYSVIILVERGFSKSWNSFFCHHGSCNNYKTWADFQIHVRRLNSFLSIYTISSIQWML